MWKAHNKAATLSQSPQALGLQPSCNVIKKETLAQVFSCEFCKTFKNTVLQWAFLVAASEYNFKL